LAKLKPQAKPRQKAKPNEGKTIPLITQIKKDRLGFLDCIYYLFRLKFATNEVGS
jgi:hypothetical protein